MVGDTNFSSTASALATSGDEVTGPGGAEFDEGTVFGVLRDADDLVGLNDYLVVVNPLTGVATKLVELDTPAGGRGIAFGPDGSTLYLIRGDGSLFTINTITGGLTLVGNIGVVGVVSLDLDPDSGTFYGIKSGADPELYNITPSGSATLVGDSVGACTLVRAPSGRWFTVSGGSLQEIDITSGAATVVGTDNPGGICGTAFAEVDDDDDDDNDDDDNDNDDDDSDSDD